MYKYETVSKEVNECVDIICNKCGCSTISAGSIGGDIGNKSVGHVHISYFGGYGSNFPGDGIEVRFDLCELCIRDIIFGFKLPAEIIDIDRLV